MTVEVNEGDTYNLGEVQVEGTASLNKELREVAAFKIGDLANFNEVEMALKRINAFLYKAGYLKAKSRAERRVDESKKTVDLVHG